MSRSTDLRMRVGDTERDTCLDQLSGDYAAGRLDLAELHHRQDRALRARTAGELAVLIADLPSTRATRLTRQAGHTRMARRRIPVRTGTLVLLLLGAGGFAAAAAAPHSAAAPPTCVATGREIPADQTCPVLSPDQTALQASADAARDAAAHASEAADGARTDSPLHHLADQANAAADTADQAVIEVQQAVATSPDSPATHATVHAAAARARRAADQAQTAAATANQEGMNSTTS